MILVLGGHREGPWRAGGPGGSLEGSGKLALWASMCKHCSGRFLVITQKFIAFCESRSPGSHRFRQQFLAAAQWDGKGR